METQSEPNKSILNKKISLKAILIIFAIIIVMFMVLFLKQYIATNSIMNYANNQLTEMATQSAENNAKSIAVVGNEYLSEENYDQMQKYVDNLVKASNISYIAVLDNKDIAKVHTNRNHIGKNLKELSDDKNIISVSVPVMSFTEQIGIVKLGIEKPTKISSDLK